MTIIIMPRKDEVHETKRSWKLRLLVMIAVLAIFLVLLFFLSYLIDRQGSIFLIGLVVLLILIMIPVAIFSLDMVFLEEPQ
jgi:4-hydroxybenzoate polyprenyltransferase